MSGMTVPLLLLMCIDAAFFLAVAGLVLVATRGRSAGIAVLKRNFAGYFSNPTGYLFILLFVFACSTAAFYPDDFFNDNLATLHQLNLYFPLIMLVYIPTITMGIWAEERRQGTDELLLTVPATDWDIVLGKYLAAAAIFSVSLIFSQIANFMVLAFLSRGELDLGLFATNYLGYWLIGLAMISLGMVGSFLTRNITIGFILGVLLNLPLAWADRADAMFSGDWALNLARFSFAEQLFDFGRGVISVRSIVFSALVIAIGLYLSMVLVGRRHWLGGKDGESLLGHFIVRVASLLVLAVSLTTFFVHHDVKRIDGTTQQVNSLSADTLAEMKSLKEKLSGENERSVIVEAFISQGIPEEYVKTKIDLLSKLREFEARGGGRVQVRVFDNLEKYSDEATRAEEQFGIRPNRVMIRERGAIGEEEIILGAAFTCGLEKVVVPFFDQGIPVEYELLRSICTVTDSKRKRLGVVNTDAQMFGGFDMQQMSQTPKQLIIDELQKQYEVIQIDPNSPIDQAVDVLMAVQPSSLTPPQLENFVAAVRRGVPTAIFEDPLPAMMNVPGTSQPKPPRGGMMGMGGPPEPKGEIQQLWDALGIRMAGSEQFGRYSADVVWQNYNPYQKVRNVPDITMEWVFASPYAPGGENSLNPQEPVVAGLQQILLLFPGAIVAQQKAGVTVEPILSTGTEAGTIGYQDLTTGGDRFGMGRKRRASSDPLVLVARIRTAAAAAPAANSSSANQPAAAASGTIAAEQVADTVTRLVQVETPTGGAADSSAPAPGDTATPDGNLAAAAAPAPDKLNVIYVSDVDLLHSQFLRVRAQPNMSEVNWKFDNVTFVLNLIDDLAQDERFIDVRKKQPRHSTLKMVEQVSADARAKAEDEIDKFNADFDAEEAKLKKAQEDSLAELNKQIAELQQKAEDSGTEPSGREIQRALQAALQQMLLKQQVEQRRTETAITQKTRDRDRNLLKIERELEKEIQKVQNRYKGLALLLPMLPPVLIGLAVFIRRRSLESEGISAARRR